MKTFLRKLIIQIFFRKPIRKYVNKRIIGKDEDLLQYLYGLLCQDETRMLQSRGGLLGIYDLDIEMNRELQKQLEDIL